MTFDVIDGSQDLDVLFEDGDYGISLSQIVFRRCQDSEGDDVTYTHWPGLSAQYVVLTATGTRELPEMYRLAIKSRKRKQQMWELATENTNRNLQMIRHGLYSQVIAPRPLTGSEVFATEELLTNGLSHELRALMLCTERAVFAATIPMMPSLLAMATANRLSGVLRAAWGSGCSRDLTEEDWLKHCGANYELFTLGAEFVRAGKLPF